MSTRPIKVSEAYRGLRNAGCGWFASAFVGVLWAMFGVQVEEQE